MVTVIMKNIITLSCLLALATARAASSGRSLQQGVPRSIPLMPLCLCGHPHNVWGASPPIDAPPAPTRTGPPRADLTPFWAEERRISNQSTPALITVVAHDQPTVRASVFGGCSGPLCPTVIDLIPYRLCFASLDASVTISTTLGRRSKFFDTQLYIFAVEDDAPPQRKSSVSANAWDPPYPQFFAAPNVVEQHFDDNAGAICSSDDDITTDICGSPGAACEPQPFGIKCPAGFTPRLLSKVDFEIRHGSGRGYKCMYAVVGAKDAPPGTDTLQLGLSIDLKPPRRLPGCVPPSLPEPSRPPPRHILPT